MIYEKLVGPEAVINRGREVIRVEATALEALESLIDDTFVAACEMIFAVQRRLVVTGMGKSGHIARKIAATFAATGTPAIFIHPSEAAHGDLGMIVEGDILLVLSNSGNTAELRAILSYGRKLGVPIIGVASRRHSLVMDLADVCLLLPRVREACAANIAPTASTTMQLALGDALAMAVMDMRGVSKAHLLSLHPAGSIGLALTPVFNVMHGPERMPLVEESEPMAKAISVMTCGCFGLAGVVDSQGRIVGVITDGDLRRHFGILQSATAREVMTPLPKVLFPDMLAGDALEFFNVNQITAAFVVGDSSPGLQPPIGIVHIHDLLRFGLN